MNKVDENLKGKIRNSVKPATQNTTPISERTYNLVEVLIECESDKNVNRYFRKIYSNDYVASSREYNYSSFLRAPFYVDINVKDNDSLNNDWYEVSSLYV